MLNCDMLHTVEGYRNLDALAILSVERVCGFYCWVVKSDNTQKILVYEGANYSRDEKNTWRGSTVNSLNVQEIGLKNLLKECCRDYREFHEAFQRRVEKVDGVVRLVPIHYCDEK